jgi:hypothetical protein
MPSRHLLILLLMAIALAPVAHAQYKWRDANGRIVYSDLPPPATVAPDALLKAPGLRPPSERNGIPAAAGGAVSAPAAATSTADRELEFRKRRLERAESERKAAGDAAKARQVAAACEETRNELRTLESGMRMSRLNERGEREFVDDEQRAARLESAKKASREHCAAS